MAIIQWTDERVEQLKKLWASGLSASEIAAQLGGIGRNGVIGKVHRLGLSGRAKSPSTPRPKMRRVMPPIVPTPKPAAIEPLIRKDKIALPNRLVDSDLDERAIGAALRALRQQMKSLADDLSNAASTSHSQNIDKRVVSYLQELSDRIPTKRPTQEALFLLGHEQETLESYAATVNEEWPQLLAGRYLSIIRAFDRTLRQFPKWRLFKRNAGRDRLSDEQRKRTAELAAEFSLALREGETQEHIDNQLPQTIDALSQSLPRRIAKPGHEPDLIEEGSEGLAEDLVVSIENIVKLIADIALAGARALVAVGNEVGSLAKDASKALWKNARLSIVDSAGKVGKKVGPKLILWCKRVLISASAVGVAKGIGLSSAIAQWIGVFPDTLRWLKPILAFLAQIA